MSICKICGKEYSYRCTVRYLPNGEIICLHDSEAGNSTKKSLSNYEKKLASRLPKNQEMKKSSLGVAYVQERN